MRMQRAGKTVRVLAGLVFAILCAGVAAYAFGYLYGDYKPRNPFAVRFARSGLDVPAHFFAAGLALLLAPLQIWGGLRRRWPRLHRTGGWLYAAAVLIGAVSGLSLARNAHGGWASGSGFSLLALAWLWMTALGIACAIAGDYERHRRWMLRSVALTAAAITLRLMLALGQGVLQLPFVTVYIAAAWGCWTINLAVCELWLRWPARRRLGSAAA
ncbi:DUF2306 domain-containing protein [Tahibacter harae]|uniref:DUF2306 domain-containing protein n=1 Tax=Tahibacter harae TaxID=2963937 RepID=A0ABT1QUS8_9GAMM|nr:DUF2306 domain-containing protein [Tahibacter harae]MCQ4166023.1 DUF2306 domain-containing protein [Tahibacter harae]